MSTAYFSHSKNAVSLFRDLQLVLLVIDVVAEAREQHLEVGTDIRAMENALLGDTGGYHLGGEVGHVVDGELAAVDRLRQASMNASSLPIARSISLS
ncbi:MAG: hypothetical protein R3C70_17965 [Geminicoccaceae bacterium]